jgi:TRAP-type transport system small permease protein
MDELGDIGSRFERGPLDRACARIEWVTVRLAALALVLMVVLTTADALARYFLNAPIEGALEISNEFLMPALVFFTISFVYSKGGHVRVTIVSEHFPPRVQRALMAVFDFLTALVFAGLTYGLVVRTLDSYGMREYSASPLGYLLAPSYAIVAVGGALMTVRAFVAAVTFQHPRVADAADLEAY